MIYFKYLWYVLKHKWFVFLEMCKYGMIIRGLLHDISKFLPSEFLPYAKYFNGQIKKGRDKTGYYKPTDTGDPKFEYAFFLHIKRNKHHWQWYIQPLDNGGIKALDMPISIIKEMVCDWRGAGRAQGTPDVVAWYLKNGEKLVLSSKTRSLVEIELGIEESEQTTNIYFR